MKITKRQLRRIIREAWEVTDHWDNRDKIAMSGMTFPDDNERPQGGENLEARLNAVWDVVRADTLASLGGQATWEEITDEVLASGYSIDPDLIESINLLPFEEQQRIFRKAFGTGSRY